MCRQLQGGESSDSLVFWIWKEVLEACLQCLCRLICRSYIVSWTHVLMTCAHVHDNLLCREDMPYVQFNTHAKSMNAICESQKCTNNRDIWHQILKLFERLLSKLSLQKRTLLLLIYFAFRRERQCKWAICSVCRLPRLSRRLFGAVGDSKSVNLKRWRNPKRYAAYFPRVWKIMLIPPDILAEKMLFSGIQFAEFSLDSYKTT